MSSTMQSIKPFLYSLLVLFLFSSCDKDRKGNSSEDEAVEMLPFSMIPSTKEYPKLSDKYIKEKKTQIENFFTDNYANDFENISFLVAKMDKSFTKNTMVTPTRKTIF